MANQASAELFLDILTKEEKEALLSKKMEEIRKKNEALRKRHEEIQNDKKVADQLMKTTPDSPSKSPTKDKQYFPNDNKMHDKPRNHSGNPAGRGKPRPKSGGDYNHVQNADEHRFRHETPKRFSFGENDERPTDFRFGEHDDRDADTNNRYSQNEKRSSNQRNFRGRGGRGGRGGSNEHYKENRSNHYNRQDSRSNEGNFRNSGDFSRQDSQGRGRGRNNYDRQDSRNSGEDNFRNSGDFSRQDSRGRGRGRNNYERQDSRSSGEDNFRNSGDFSRHDHRGRGHQSNRQGSNNRHSGEFQRNNYKDKREQYDDADFEPNRKRAHGGSHYQDEQVEGPPPDPAYNFLSDRTRVGQQQTYERIERDPPRRHPKNFGGQDFSNVKNQMKNVKERQHRSGPPKSKMEMAVTMTGKERRQYIEWKADRDRVDNARIERQKSSSGEWRREWDKEKFETEETKQTEPAKRPAGRIGSGRFDRGDDERKKGNPEEHPRGNGDKSPTKSRGDIPPKARGNRHPETPPRMAGRGRGRGRGIAKSANEAKPQRMRSTSSGDERVVNCDSDLLVIKLENTPGDNSVEVEYSDGEVPATKPTRVKPATGGTATHGAQTEELWWDEDDDLTLNLVQDGLDGDDALEHRQLFEDADQGAHGDQDVVVGDDEDEWEDCDDDSFYSTEKSQNSTDSREGYGSQLKVNTQLNPDAPEFTPTSPLSPPSPRSPREKRQKVKHAEKSAGTKKSESKGQKRGTVSSTDKATNDAKTSHIKQKGTDSKSCDNSGEITTDSIDKQSCDGKGQKAVDDSNVSKTKNLKDRGDNASVSKDSVDKAGPQTTEVDKALVDSVGPQKTEVNKTLVDSSGPQTTDVNKTLVYSAGPQTTEVSKDLVDSAGPQKTEAHSITAGSPVDNTSSGVVTGTAEDSTKPQSGAEESNTTGSGANETTILDSGVKDTIEDGDGAEETIKQDSGVESEDTAKDGGSEETTQEDCESEDITSKESRNKDVESNDSSEQVATAETNEDVTPNNEEENDSTNTETKE